MKKFIVVMTILALVAILTASCAGVPTSTSTSPTPTPTPAPAPVPLPTPTGKEANFRLLISDEVNGIYDFSELYVTVRSIGVHQGGESGIWHTFEFTDDKPEIDLTQVKGEDAELVWAGTLPEGEYTKVFIYVDEIHWTMANDDDGATAENEDGEPGMEVKLPSNKLQINKPFTITSTGKGEDQQAVVNYVFDITVMKAGNSGKYILKPQLGQSGANQQFNEISPQGNTERHQEKHKETHGKPEGRAELNLEIIDEDIAPGDSITLLVTFEDEPVAEATVEVNGEELENLTGEDGKITFTIPEDADELEIEVKKGKLEGELEIEFQEPGE